MPETNASNDTPGTIQCPVGGPGHRVQRVTSMAVQPGSPLAMPRPPSRWLTTLALALVAPAVALAILFSRTDGSLHRTVGLGVALLLAIGVPQWVLYANRRYQMALFRWRQLCYCQDCDRAFVPGGELNRRGREVRREDKKA